jgi:hypothetical protein
MHFHHYMSVRSPTYGGSIDDFLDAGLYGRMNPARLDAEDQQTKDNAWAPLLLEKSWRLIERPFYNVYPIVATLCNKTTLDVPWARVSFPYSPLLFRFPVGHEPHGIAAALVFTVPPPSVFGFDYGELPAFNRCWADDPSKDRIDITPCAKLETHGMSKGARVSCSYILSKSIVCFVQFASPNGKTLLLWSLQSGSWHETVEETIARPGESGTEHLGDIDGERASLFLCRLSVLAALVGQGEDLITPEILAKDQRAYGSASQSQKQWIEGRAARINGRGFSFGRELQNKTAASPHWRNPHMALFWTGQERSVPVLKLRAGCVVSSTHLSDIPTGFFGSQHEDAAEQSTEHTFVYRVPVPKRLRFRVMRRDGFRCQLCGLTQKDGIRLEVDHKVPVAKGGKTVIENLWTLCHPCNNGKSDSDLYDSAADSQHHCATETNLSHGCTTTNF